jgi:hypothetical protein
MKKYRATKGMNIRSGASATAAKVGTIAKGQEFFSNRQEPRPGKQEWAAVLDNTGRMLGWVCVFDSLYRYLEELPQPAPVADALPPIPEPAGGLTEYQELAAKVDQLRRDVDALINRVGLK